MVVNVKDVVKMNKIINEYSDEPDCDEEGLCLNTKLYLSSYEELTEESFYPPVDNRTWGSGVEDIEDGDNFAEYTKYYYNTYGKEIFDN